MWYRRVLLLPLFTLAWDNPVAPLACARPDSGTRCSRAVFIRLAGIVQTAFSRSISLHTAPRTSPPRAARTGQLPVRQRLLAGLGQRDEDDAAETDLTLAAPDDEPLDPATGSGLLDVEVQPVAVAVSAGRSGAHEGGGEPVVGMSAPWLASMVLCAGTGDIIHSLIVAGMATDHKRCSRRIGRRRNPT